MSDSQDQHPSMFSVEGLFLSVCVVQSAVRVLSEKFFQTTSPALSLASCTTLRCACRSPAHTALLSLSGIRYIPNTEFCPCISTAIPCIAPYKGSVLPP